MSIILRHPCKVRMLFALLIAFAFVPAEAIRLQADAKSGADEPVKKFEGLSTQLSAAMAVSDNIETIVLYDTAFDAIFCYEVVTDYVQFSKDTHYNFGNITSGTEYAEHCLLEDGLLPYLNKKSPYSRMQYVKSLKTLTIDGGDGASCFRRGYMDPTVPANDDLPIKVSIWSKPFDPRVKKLTDKTVTGGDYTLMETYTLDECKHDIEQYGTVAKYEGCFGERGKCRWACNHLVEKQPKNEWAEACQTIIENAKAQDWHNSQENFYVWHDKKDAAFFCYEIAPGEGAEDYVEKCMKKYSILPWFQTKKAEPNGTIYTPSGTKFVLNTDEGVTCADYGYTRFAMHDDFYNVDLAAWAKPDDPRWGDMEDKSGIDRHLFLDWIIDMCDSTDIREQCYPHWKGQICNWARAERKECRTPDNPLGECA